MSQLASTIRVARAPRALRRLAPLIASLALGFAAPAAASDVYVTSSGSISPYEVGAGGALTPKGPATVGGGAFGIAVRRTDTVPPDTIIDSGPAGVTNDPTPSFTFHSTDAGSTFRCDTGGPYGFTPCTSPETTQHLADGAHTFAVKARDPAGNTDPSPASRSFTVKTAEVKRSGSTLVVTAAPGATDNLLITQPSASTLRVSDLPSAPYSGSGIHTGTGCARSGDYTANCSSTGITKIQVSSGGGADRILDGVGVPGSLNGGPGDDTLVGGSGNDVITGGPGADSFKGRNGSDNLLARDLTSDASINCDGGSTPGSADKADLDLLPKDPDSIVAGCETKTRH